MHAPQVMPWVHPWSCMHAQDANMVVHACSAGDALDAYVQLVQELCKRESGRACSEIDLHGESWQQQPLVLQVSICKHLHAGRTHTACRQDYQPVNPTSWRPPPGRCCIALPRPECLLRASLQAPATSTIATSRARRGRGRPWRQPPTLLGGASRRSRSRLSSSHAPPPKCL